MASMRPRLDSRGEQPWWEDIDTANDLLQCGHGLIAVENSLHQDTFFGERSLQCGHGLIAVENTYLEALNSAP